MWLAAVEMSLQSLFDGQSLVKHMHNQLLIHVCFLPNVDLILTKLLQICCDVPVDEQNLRLTLLHFLQHAVLLRLDGAHGCLCLVDLTRIAVPHRLYLTIEIVFHLLSCHPDFGAKFTARLLYRFLDEYFHFSCKFRVNVSIKLRKGRLWLCAASLQGWIRRRLLEQLGGSPVSLVFVHFGRTLGRMFDLIRFVVANPLEGLLSFYDHVWFPCRKDGHGPVGRFKCCVLSLPYWFFVNWFQIRLRCSLVFHSGHLRSRCGFRFVFEWWWLRHVGTRLHWWTEGRCLNHSSIEHLLDIISIMRQLNLAIVIQPEWFLIICLISLCNFHLSTMRVIGCFGSLCSIEHVSLQS